MTLDVPAAFGGSLERAAADLKAKVLVVVSTTDHVVTPGPALEFSRARSGGSRIAERLRISRRQLRSRHLGIHSESVSGKVTVVHSGV